LLFGICPFSAFYFCISSLLYYSIKHFFFQYYLPFFLLVSVIFYGAFYVALPCTERRIRRSSPYGALPHAPPIFFEKKIGSKSFNAKKHSLFWEDVFIGLCEHRMFFSRGYSSQKIKSNITLSIFCSGSVKALQSLGRAKALPLG